MLKLDWLKIYETEYSVGESTIKIAKKYGCAKRSVRMNFLELNLKIRNKSEARKFVDIREIVGSGEGSTSWKGGKILRKNYYYIHSLNHPYRTTNNYYPEHRLVMEKFLGRYLQPEEYVHHIDHNTINNSIENLHLFKNLSEHQRLLYLKWILIRRNLRLSTCLEDLVILCEMP